MGAAALPLCAKIWEAKITAKIWEASGTLKAIFSLWCFSQSVGWFLVGHGQLHPAATVTGVAKPLLVYCSAAVQLPGRKGHMTNQKLVATQIHWATWLSTSNDTGWHWHRLEAASTLHTILPCSFLDLVVPGLIAEDKVGQEGKTFESPCTKRPTPLYRQTPLLAVWQFSISGCMASNTSLLGKSRQLGLDGVWVVRLYSLKGTMLGRSPPWSSSP